MQCTLHTWLFSPMFTYRCSWTSRMTTASVIQSWPSSTRIIVRGVNPKATEPYIIRIVYWLSLIILATPGISDRARRRLFTTRTLRPLSKEYRTISQKILSAAASRYLIFWFSQYLSGLLASDPDSTFLQLPICIISVRAVCVVVHGESASSRERERAREGSHYIANHRSR